MTIFSTQPDICLSPGSEYAERVNNYKKRFREKAVNMKKYYENYFSFSIDISDKLGNINDSYLDYVEKGFENAYQEFNFNNHKEALAKIFAEIKEKEDRIEARRVEAQKKEYAAIEKERNRLLNSKEVKAFDNRIQEIEEMLTLDTTFSFLFEDFWSIESDLERAKENLDKMPNEIREEKEYTYIKIKKDIEEAKSNYKTIENLPNKYSCVYTNKKQNEEVYFKDVMLFSEIYTKKFFDEVIEKLNTENKEIGFIEIIPTKGFVVKLKPQTKPIKYSYKVVTKEDSFKYNEDRENVVSFVYNEALKKYFIVYADSEITNELYLSTTYSELTNTIFQMTKKNYSIKTVSFDGDYYSVLFEPLPAERYIVEREPTAQLHLESLEFHKRRKYKPIEQILNEKTKRLDVFYEKTTSDFTYHTFETLEELQAHIEENKKDYSVDAVHTLYFSSF